MRIGDVRNPVKRRTLVQREIIVERRYGKLHVRGHAGDKQVAFTPMPRLTLPAEHLGIISNGVNRK
jgi:hypothetical protein